MSVSTINDERRTEIRWNHGDEYQAPLVYRVNAYAWPDQEPVVVAGPAVDRASDLHESLLHVRDPEVCDEIARAWAHAAATLRGDIATRRGGEVLGALRGTPDGEIIADSLDRAREGSVS